ncbi:MAG: hypothetical protein A2X12_09050 [Bacteroidetes bacterium GWE2_29_8]|nr:MAG: hypothetical protein A2X12_09050 [Bacteroidetes bacterium GWE2_29_8]OFY17156.1 MAG: hypothetical protein A2X02_09345 [Bacteroidetes bacterium GWF2_29_10]
MGYELRNGYLFLIIFPFVFSITYILSFISEDGLNIISFNTILWLSLYFISNFICNVSVLKQRKEEIRFYFLLTKPYYLVFAKIIINFFYIYISLLFLAILNYNIFFANNALSFLLFSLIFSLGISIINTFSAYLAVFTDNSYVISGISNLPMIIPFLLITMKISEQILINPNVFFFREIFYFGLIVFALLFLVSFFMDYIWRE